MSHLRIISAGAGSGKTFRLTSEMTELLQKGVRPSGIIATTFTKKAAAELQERVRIRLLEAGMSKEADELTNALIGTVHSLGVKLLQRFAFEAGVSPRVEIIAEEDQQTIFNNSIAMVLHAQRVEAIDELCRRLGLSGSDDHNWRQDLYQLINIARSNAMSAETLQRSRDYAWSSFAQYLPEPGTSTSAELHERFRNKMEETIAQVEQNGDETKVTAEAVQLWKQAARQITRDGGLNWQEWVKISKTNPGKKSQGDAEDLQTMALEHEASPSFQSDIQGYIFHIFDGAIDAIQEYEQYKNRRGLIDYTDMETRVLHLLDHPAVQEILSEELDLLMVDEFQDTNPIQLEIFLKLSRLARFSVWVGDPKQAIYGFRGADPELMQAIIRQSGGVKPEDIQRYSWRSRPDLVHAVNAIFTGAFPELPTDQVALEPRQSKAEEPALMGPALQHWHFLFDENPRKRPAKPWMERCIAQKLSEWLAQGQTIVDPHSKTPRLARPGDVAILCRTNNACKEMADALHLAGLKAAIARPGLYDTAEARLLTACLKFLLNPKDSLSIAEIMLLADGLHIEDIIENRLHFLDQIENNQYPGYWGRNNPIIQKLLALTKEATEYSIIETLDIVTETLDLRRIVAAWGNAEQRLDNLEVLRQTATQYEDACTRLHSAASLAGFLLRLNLLHRKSRDSRAAGLGPDCVEVLTYHKSKGLEWPITICHDLDGQLQDKVWGFEIISENQEINIDKLLENRLIRFWVNPYGLQHRNTGLVERIAKGPEQARATQKALREEARLLYVGLTRARDYLLFPTSFKQSVWLNRVSHQGQENHAVFDPHMDVPPWIWKDEYIPLQTNIIHYPATFVRTPIQPGKTFFLEPRAGKKDFPSAYWDLTKGKGLKIDARAESPAFYGPPLPVQEGNNLSAIAKAIKAIHTAWNIQYSGESLQDIVQLARERYCPDEDIEPLALRKAAHSWAEYYIQRFQPKAMYRRHPIMDVRQERIFYAVLDMVLDTGESLVIIQNSSFAADHTSSKWEQRALQLAQWLHFSKKAAEAAFGKPVSGTYVHFVLSQALVEVKTKE